MAPKIDANNTVRIGLVGCGRISDKHLNAIKNTPGAEIIGVCDPVKKKAVEAAKK